MRTVLILGVAWFVAADVCRVLGIQNPSDVHKTLEEDEVKTLDGVEGFGMRGPPANLISESGLYALILRSRKPAALKFRKWVTAEVLPALRRDGAQSNRRKITAQFIGSTGPIEINHWPVNFSHWNMQWQCIGNGIAMHWSAHCSPASAADVSELRALGRSSGEMIGGFDTEPMFGILDGSANMLSLTI